ncbi:MAG: prepilin peptidase [Clostridia bacterium]|nr:prepilin peptidase [Clostridia bacterium]
MLVYLQSIIVVLLCVYASITDIKSKKIYNKIVLVSLAVSSCIYIVFYKEIETEFIVSHIINNIITLILSFLFYYFKIWAAGDAKLFWVISFIIPFSIYEAPKENIFPSVFLLIMIFSSAFIYVAIETVILWIKDREKFTKTSLVRLSRINWIDFSIQYFTAYFSIMLINNIISTFFPEFNRYNGALLLICNMLFITFLYRAVSKRRNYVIIMIIAILLNIIYTFLYGFVIYSINIKMIFLVLILFLFRQISEKYNYEEINVDDLKPGMILAFETILMFYGSKVKGLPEKTTETTDSRITEAEIDSIKRWSRTKKGRKQIVIVRHMPFAPFIFVGTTIYLVIKVIL